MNAHMDSESSSSLYTHIHTDTNSLQTHTIIHIFPWGISVIRAEDEKDSYLAVTHPPLLKRELLIT